MPYLALVGYTFIFPLSFYLLYDDYRYADFSTLSFDSGCEIFYLGLISLFLVYMLVRTCEVYLEGGSIVIHKLYKKYRFAFSEVEEIRKTGWSPHGTVLIRFQKKEGHPRTVVFTPYDIEEKEGDDKKSEKTRRMVEYLNQKIAP